MCIEETLGEQMLIVLLLHIYAAHAICIEHSWMNWMTGKWWICYRFGKRVKLIVLFCVSILASRIIIQYLLSNSNILVFRLFCSTKISNVILRVFVCRIIKARIVVRIIITGIFVFVVLVESDGRLLGRCARRNGWRFRLSFQWRQLTFRNGLCWCWCECLIGRWLACRRLFSKGRRIFGLFGTQLITTGRNVLRMGRVQEFLVARAGKIVRCAPIIAIEIIWLELILLALLLLGQFLFSFILQFITCKILLVQFGMILTIVFINCFRMILAVIDSRIVCRFRLI